MSAKLSNKKTTVGKKHKYIPCNEVHKLSIQELLERCNWLIESQVVRYCKTNDPHILEDAHSIAKLIIIKSLPLYDPSRNVNFEGWVRLRIAHPLVQMMINSTLPVHAPESSARSGRRPKRPTLHIIYESEENEYDIGNDPIYQTFDTTVETNDNNLLKKQMSTIILKRISKLPKQDRELINRYIKIAKGYRGYPKYNRVREVLIPAVTKGYEKLAKELVLF